MKIYTIESDQLSPPVIGEGFCTDLVRHSDYAKLEAKYAALATKLNDVCAENAALKNPNNWLAQSDYGYEAAEVSRGNGSSGDEALYAGMVAIINRITTPATDAWVNEQRAVGVEMFADHLRTNDNESSPARLLALGAEEFAALLRGSQV